MENNTNNTTNTVEDAMVLESRSKVADDFKHSLLVVSLLANTFILVGWVALQVTSLYDYQVSLFLFYR
jgi:hypothetical protein